MFLILDERETQLYDICLKLSGDSTTTTIVKQVLPLGDAVLKETVDGPDLIIFERKSLRDLLASIKDGRYEEQSHRLLHSSDIPAHHILYIVEGMYSQTRTAQEKQTILSAITSLNLFKGFSVLRTCSLQETAETLIGMTAKIEREFKKGKTLVAKMERTPPTPTPPSSSSSSLENTFVSAQESMPPTTLPPAKYCEVVKKVKKENITPQNIGEVILSQIPGISATTAIAIMSHFSNFSDLMQALRETPERFKEMSYTDSSGKTRKISTTVLKNLAVYLRGKESA